MDIVGVGCLDWRDAYGVRGDVVKVERLEGCMA